MRNGKELIEASKKFSKEDVGKSWFETLLTLVLGVISFLLALKSSHLVVQIAASLLCALLYVRLFIIYHDYQHHAILQNSVVARPLMFMLGIYLLAPPAIWKRSHDHHHNNNSKLTISGIGSYPTLSKTQFLNLSDRQRFIYLTNRHPLTIIFGYFTLFIYWLNIKSFAQSPAKHFDSVLALFFHLGMGSVILGCIGLETFFIAWFMPFFLAFAIGSYLFYCQHNFPGAKFKANIDWKYDYAALASTSFMVMNPVMNWFTGNIGYHHIHHLNSRIPFYRLREAMESMPELQNAPTTSWKISEMIHCLRLKIWDPDRGRLISLNEL